MVAGRLQTTCWDYDAISLWVSLQSYAVYKRKLTHGFILILFSLLTVRSPYHFLAQVPRAISFQIILSFRSGVNEIDLLWILPHTAIKDFRDEHFHWV